MQEASQSRHLSNPGFSAVSGQGGSEGDLGAELRVSCFGTKRY